jgi:hypothetical protein
MAAATTHQSALRGMLAGPLQLPPFLSSRPCLSGQGVPQRLSVYNPTDTCAIHEERRPFHQDSGGRKAKDAPGRPMEDMDVVPGWIRGLE